MKLLNWIKSLFFLPPPILLPNWLMSAESLASSEIVEFPKSSDYGLNPFPSTIVFAEGLELTKRTTIYTSEVVAWIWQVTDHSLILGIVSTGPLFSRWLETNCLYPLRLVNEHVVIDEDGFEHKPQLAWQVLPAALHSASSTGYELAIWLCWDKVSQFYWDFGITKNEL